jgi:O-antigen/teichoic acid export membrane protein
LSPQPIAAVANAECAPAPVWRRILSFAFSTRMLALADQAVVSGTSFLTTVLIGRFTYPSQLGIYVLAMSLLISAMNFQHSLIALPYTIRRNRAQDHDPVNAGHSLALAAVLGLAAALVIAVVAVVMAAFATDPRLAVVTATLSAVLPLMLVRDFGRDFGIARLQFTEVLALDLTVSLIQVGALGILAWLDRMSGVAALAATGAACAAAGIAGFCWTRGNFAFRIAGLFDTARESWDAGKWLLANLLALVTQVQITYWLVAAIAGTAATGVYAACMSVAGLASPMITGLSNPMFAKAASAYAQGGIGRLRREALKDALLLGVATTAFCTMILLFGADIMRLLFRSGDYAVNDAVIVSLALWQLATAIGVPASNALSVMDRSRENFCHGLAGLLLSTLVLALLVGWGALGAALALLAGSAARSAMRWWSLWRASPDGSTGQ